MPGPTEGLNGAAHAAGGRPLGGDYLVVLTEESGGQVRIGRVIIIIDIHLGAIRVLRVEIGENSPRREGEIGFGLGPTEGTRGGIVGACSILSGIEGAEPNTGLLPRVSDLGGESTPRPLPDAAESDLEGRSVSLRGVRLPRRCLPSRHEAGIEGDKDGEETRD